jgi:CxxC motif-containing protein
MKEERTITCIGCPMGCLVKVTTEGGKITDIANYTCKKGREYAIDELTNPTRMVTAVIPVEGRAEPLSVKTKRFIPKDKIFECLEAIRAAKITLPVAIGDIVVPDVCGTGVDVVATKFLG